MNIRRALYFGSWQLRGSALPRYYEKYVREDEAGLDPDTARNLLVQMLAHCECAVPYYAEVMSGLGSFRQDPEAYLARLPILTKDLIRTHSARLCSADLARRRWYWNTSGGSTGEPVRLIQDQDYVDRSYPLTLLYSRWAGRQVGEPAVCLWGSERDILQGGRDWRATLSGRLTRTRFVNAFYLTPERIRGFIRLLNRERPKLVIAYREALWEVTRFVERERIPVTPQQAIMSSASVLRPEMRRRIEAVFGCKVYDRYGSREVGDIACQCPALTGLHVAPWGNYVEIVDEQGNRLPDGVEGQILVTSLSNYAMPLLRYRIGDRGILSPHRCHCGRPGQVLERVVGRSCDAFRKRDGTFVDSGFCEGLLYFRDWVHKFQVIQKSYSLIVFNIVKADAGCSQGDLDEIAAKTRFLMGDDCRVEFRFVEDIQPTASGKYRYTISEVQD